MPASFCAVLVAIERLRRGGTSTRLAAPSSGLPRTLLPVSVSLAATFVNGPVTHGIVTRTALIWRLYCPG